MELYYKLTRGCALFTFQLTFFKKNVFFFVVCFKKREFLFVLCTFLSLQHSLPSYYENQTKSRSEAALLLGSVMVKELRMEREKRRGYDMTTHIDSLFSFIVSYRTEPHTYHPTVVLHREVLYTTHAYTRCLLSQRDSHNFLM